MTTPILVTGGTGTLGRQVVPRLRDAGYDIRVLSRRGWADEDGIRYLTGDLATGEGLEPAVDGVETIIHCASTPKGDEVKTRQLVLRAASQPGCGTWCTSRWAAPIGSRSPAASTGRCSATSLPSWPRRR